MIKNSKGYSYDLFFMFATDFPAPIASACSNVSGRIVPLVSGSANERHPAMTAAPPMTRNGSIASTESSPAMDGASIAPILATVEHSPIAELRTHVGNSSEV